jgi:ketosteroid isomerase-like protein
MTKAVEDAIREIELRFNEAWGRHDADAMVESLADDAQFANIPYVAFDVAFGGKADMTYCSANVCF